MKKITQEQYIQRLKDRNPTIVCIDTYVDTKTPILHKCTVCEHEWLTSPGNITHSTSPRGCPNCKNINTGNRCRKTKEDYIEELKTKNTLVVLDDEYVDSRTPIYHKCVLCGNRWKLSPSNALKGKACPPCSYKRGGQLNTLTHDEYVKKLHEHQPNIECLEKYINGNTPIKHKCIICNYIWEKRPCHIDTGCPNCNNPLPYSKDGYQSFLDKQNKNITVLDDFVNYTTSIKHRCNICDNIWLQKPTNIINSNRNNNCPECIKKELSQKFSLLKEDFIKKVQENDSNITILEYNGLKNPIKCKCMVCNKEWKVASGIQLYESHCPSCVAKQKGMKLRLTTDDFLSKVKADITLLSEFINTITPIKVKCNKCCHEWIVNSPRSLYLSGCPKCNQPHGETKIEEYLQRNRIDFNKNHPFNNLFGIGNGHLTYDFYLPFLNKLIEFQGEQHERPIEYFGGEAQFKKQQEHDRRKREYAKEHSIELIEIWYYEFDKIEEILNEKLLNVSVTTTGL